MKNIVFAVVTSILLFSGFAHSATVSITESVLGSATLNDGSVGVELEFVVHNNTVDDVFAFIVGNNSADSNSALSNWAINVVVFRPDTSSHWTAELIDGGDGTTFFPVPLVLALSNPSVLPGFTRGFYYFNGIGSSNNISPGSSLGGFLGNAASAASPFAALGVNPSTGIESTYLGETAHVSAVPLPASLFLFLSGLVSLGWARKNSNH